MSNYREFLLQPEHNERLINFCGQFDEHLRLLEKHLDIEIHNRGYHFKLVGDLQALAKGQKILQALYALTETESLSPPIIQRYLQQEVEPTKSKRVSEEAEIKTRRQTIKARGSHQVNYVNTIQKNDLTFGIGPAGTGKTYLAAACAAEALDNESIRRLILVRPAVEAGERLGFLPGDLSQKIDPYLRPLYDALYEMLGFERVTKLQERNIIEVAPLAYMRGRTLNEAFIILDEAQNTTIEQMKMFLTRIGFGSKAVVTGDVTQIDLPHGHLSGLRHVLEVLKGTPEIGFCYFDSKDVVRHPLVQKIVQAYEQHTKMKGYDDKTKKT